MAGDREDGSSPTVPLKWNKAFLLLGTLLHRLEGLQKLGFVLCKKRPKFGG
jgi:hypothetical protein